MYQSLIDEDSEVGGDVEAHEYSEFHCSFQRQATSGDCESFSKQQKQKEETSFRSSH